MKLGEESKYLKHSVLIVLFRHKKGGGIVKKEEIKRKNHNEA